MGANQTRKTRPELRARSGLLQDVCRGWACNEQLDFFQEPRDQTSGQASSSSAAAESEAWIRRGWSGDKEAEVRVIARQGLSKSQESVNALSSPGPPMLLRAVSCYLILLFPPRCRCRSS